MGMATALKLMSALCWVCGVVLFAFNYYFVLVGESVQRVWDFVVDPLVLVTMVLIVAANVRLSLDMHDKGMGRRNLHMDVFTMVIGFIGALYLYNYLSKFGALDPNALMWTFLACAVIVIMPVSAIIYWRQAKRAQG